MSKFPIDLKQFKKVEENDTHTVLRDKNGHEFKVAHGALGKDVKAQLKQIPMHDKNTISEREKDVVREARQRLFKGGDVKSNKYNPKLVESKKVPMMADGGLLDPSEMTQMAKTEISPEQQQYFQDLANYQQQNQQMAMNAPNASPGLNEPVAPTQPEVQPQNSAWELNQSSSDPSLSNAKQAAPQASQPMAPLEPAISPRVPSAQGLPGQNGMMGGQQGGLPNFIQRGLGTQTAGLYQEAGALGQIGKEQAQALGQQNEQAEQNAHIYDSKVQENDQERQHIFDDIANMHIDPNKYIHA
jgi:hypothetical protein